MEPARTQPTHPPQNPQGATLPGGESQMEESEAHSFFLLGKAAGKFFLMDKVLGLLARTVDVLMIYFIVTDPRYGVWKALFVAGAYNYVLVSLTVFICNYVTNKYQIDITGVDNLRALPPTNKRRSLGWYLWRIKESILARRATIFWLGSWFQLDPDYVTLLLQDPQKGVIQNNLKITLPSTILAMIVWTAIYWVSLTQTGLAEQLRPLLDLLGAN